nr:MAG: hypothetical protein DIU78_12725 [Pseudomonadota bacterium]
MQVALRRALRGPKTPRAARAEARRLRILRDGFFRVPARVTLASVHVLPVRRPVGAGASASDTEET